jgi:Reverse transcriptase (RNA-dependent DNA polymerase)
MSSNSPFLNNKLLALQKGEKIRPICCSDPWLRNAGSSVVASLKVEINEVMEPIQLGVGVSGGVEIVVHAAQMFFEGMQEHANNVIVALDCKNAFNSVDRYAIRDEIEIHFPDMLPHYDWTYGNRSKLYDSTGRFLFYSECGVRQGDSLAALWFALATLPILKQAAKDFPNVTAMSIMDDVSLMGPIVEAVECSKFIINEWRKINLTAVPEKSVIIHNVSADMDLIRSTGYRSTSDGHVLLGAPVGTEEYIKDELENKLRTYTQTVDLITTFPAILAVPLLRSCIASKPNYIMRCLEPNMTAHMAVQFDNIIDKALSTICDISTVTFNKYSSTVRTLPAYLGGIGLSSAANTRVHAYTASFSAAIVYIYNGLVGFFNKHCKSSNKNKISLFYKSKKKDETGVHVLVDWESHKEVVESQSSLCQGQHRDTHKRLCEELPNVQRVLFMSLSSKGSSSWINCISSLSQQHHLTPLEYQRRLIYGLLLPIIDEDHRSATKCCRDNTVVTGRDMYHPLCCNGAHARIIRHDCVVNALVDALRRRKAASNDVTIDLEIKKRIPQANPAAVRDKEIDIWAMIDKTIYWIDVRISCPAAPSYVTEYGSGTSLTTGAKVKERRYEEELILSPDVKLISFVIDDTGTFSKQASQFVDLIFGINKAIIEASVHQKKDRKYLLNTIRTAIIRGNSRMITKYLEHFTVVQVGGPDHILSPAVHTAPTTHSHSTTSYPGRTREQSYSGATQTTEE